MQNGSEEPASDSQVNGMTRNDGIPGGIEDSGEVSLDREHDQESGSVSSELCKSGLGNDPFIDLKKKIVAQCKNLPEFSCNTNSSL